jgi:two-component system, LytTR family, response regulator
MKAIIVEDEIHNRAALKNLIEEFCDDVNVVGVAETVTEAIDLIHKVRPDIVFMDIELQTGTGFDVLARVQNLDFDVIFTTAFEHYAIKAIKFSSLDYLLKPIDVEELQGAVNKARVRQRESSQRQQLEVLLTNMNGNGVKKICLATADRVEFVRVTDIILCEASGSYTNVYLNDKRKIMVSRHLKEYETLLADENFMRVHNSFLINLNEVKQFVKSDGGYIVMNDNYQVSISPKKRDEFFARMN